MHLHPLITKHLGWYLPQFNELHNLDTRSQGVIPENFIYTLVYIVNTNILPTSHAHDHLRESSSPTYSQIIRDDAHICTLNKKDFMINKNILNKILNKQNSRVTFFSTFSKIERAYI